jgi:aspartyl-tRNA(Asn)/glutamyl-tRNA(Gln) amidotransferase subunit A
MAANLAGAGLEVTRVPSRFSFERLFEIQRSTMLYEAGRAMKAFLDLPAGQVGDKLLEAIRHGLTIPTARYLDERGEIDRMRRTHFGADHPGDIYLWPAAPGPAPEGLAWTGDPRFISPWTALGGPMLTVPAGATATGLPLGCLLMAAPGQDHRLAAMGLRLAPAIERHPIAGD